jgi:hypothetical protein
MRRPTLYWMREWEHPTSFGSNPVVLLSIGPLDFGLHVARPGGGLYVNVYLGVRAVQIDFDPYA